MPDQSGTPVAKRRKPVAPSRPLRFPAFITLALTTTICVGCVRPPLVYAAVIGGLERKLDPLPLSTAGLSAAVAGRRWVAVVRPWGPPLANRANPGHWWCRRIDGGRPILLAEHVHDAAPLPADAGLAVELLARFLPPPVPRPDDAPPPF